MIRHYDMTTGEAIEAEDVASRAPGNAGGPDITPMPRLMTVQEAVTTGPKSIPPSPVVGMPPMDALLAR